MSRHASGSSQGGLLPPSVQATLIIISSLGVVALLIGYALLSGKIGSAERAARAARDDMRAMRKQMADDTSVDTEAQIIKLRAGMKRLDNEVETLTSRLETLNSKLADKRNPQLEEALAGLTALAADLDKIDGLAKKTAEELAALKNAPKPDAVAKSAPVDDQIAARIAELETALSDLGRKIADASRNKNQPKINEEALRNEIEKTVREELKRLRESLFRRRPQRE